MLHSWIKESREIKSLAQSHCARVLNVSLPTWKRWESGKSRPNKAQRLAIANLTGCLAVEYFEDITRFDLERLPLYLLLSLTPAPSRQTIYNWQAGKTRPNRHYRAQLEKIIAAREKSR